MLTPTKELILLVDSLYSSLKLLTIYPDSIRNYLAHHPVNKHIDQHQNLKHLSV